MSYLPCKNPACKSHGKPHPNCKCYGDMAEGGAAEPFCSKENPHQATCEYFSSGGTVGHLESSHAVSGHISHDGIIGMLKMDGADIEKYDKSIKKGHKHIDSHMDSVFSNKHPESWGDRSKNHELIDKWISKGGIADNIHQEMYKQHNPMHGFAEGGKVEHEAHDGVLKNHPAEMAYPAQNVMLQAAKGRVSNYLSSLRPQEHTPKLAFDDNPDQTSQKRTYKDAVKIADHPLSLVHKIARGTITPDEIGHLKVMYPEVYDSLQKKVTEKVIHAQLHDDKKPSLKVRQGLSLLMGTPLSGDFTPQNIMAAQAVFAGAKQAQAQGATQPPQSKPTGSKSALSKSDSSFLTGGQALSKRQQRSS